MENRWDMIENCVYASLSNNAYLTKEEHKKMISKNQAMVFPLVLNGDAFVCVEMTNKDNGRKYILACGNEDSWLNVRYEFKIRNRWTTSRLSIGAAINTVRRGDFAGVCFIFNQDMIWLDIDELKSMDKSNELSKFIIALVRGIPLDATNEDGKTCLVVAEDEVTMERFARQILSNNPQSLNHIEYIPSTRQQIYNMVCGDSNWDGIVIVDRHGSTTMVSRIDILEWSKLHDSLVESSVEEWPDEFKQVCSDKKVYSDCFAESQSGLHIIPSKVIANNMRRDILQGGKTPHSASQPVIHYEDGKYYLASFAFFYTREDIEAGEVNRPSFWALADIKTGEIVDRRYTSDVEFSNAQYDIKYNVRADDNYDTSTEYYDKAYATLDSVREKLLKTGEVDMSEYKAYVQKIIANIPRAYRRFYLELSFTPGDICDSNSNSNRAISSTTHGANVNNTQIEYCNDNSTINNKNLSRIVYQGQSERELTNILLANGGVDWLNQDVCYSKNPKGIILVTKDMQNTWIAKRKGFMGWNVQVSDEINIEVEQLGVSVDDDDTPHVDFLEYNYCNHEWEMVNECFLHKSVIGGSDEIYDMYKCRKCGTTESKKRD